MRSLLVAVFAVELVRASFMTPTLTIANAIVIDVSNGALRRRMTIVIDGERIAGVSPTPAGAPPEGAVDATGLYVIPGLWDMHTHAYFDWPSDFGDSYVMPLFVANGITGIRDMGGDLDEVLRARSDVAAHRIVGPRMVVSGPMLDGPHSSYKPAMPIATAEDGRRAVDLLQGRGVDFIKIQSGVPREGYFAAAAEARRLGVEFEGHVPDAIRAKEAVAAGQRTFEHLIGIFEASTTNEDAYLTRSYGGRAPDSNKSLAAFLDRYDAAREAGVIRLLAEHAVWQCPTLFWERGQWLVDVIDYTKDPDIAYTPDSWMARRYPNMQRSILQSLDTDPIEVRRRFVEHELDIVRKLHAAGVPFLAGTDTPAGVDVTPGISLHLELQRFIAAGFTPLQALQTATINPARFFGKTSLYGTVAAGRVADLVLLRGNPLADIANTRTIAGVVADGRYFSPAALEALRARIREYAKGR